MFCAIGWFSLCAGWYAVVNHAYQRLDPERQGVKNYDDFIERMPAPEGFVVVPFDGQDFLRVEGPTQSFFALPSGSSGYVFDKNGQLVDWTSDVGDDPRFARKWGFGHWPGPGMTSQEALKWFNEGK
jgi:hypothetical protein